MLYKKILFGLAIFVLVSMACKLTGGDSGISLGATEAPPIDISATQSALGTTVAAQATTLAQATLDALAATELASGANNTATAAALSAEQTQAAQSASVTQAPSVEATSTPAVDSSATQQAQAFLGIVQQLLDEGIINTKDGEYHRLDDFNESWAQLGYYQWWKTGYSPENFILSADIAWESASDRANWPEAGCGIVFSEDNESDHHLAYLSLDGFGRLAQISRGQWKNLAAQRYGNLSVPNGDAKIMLVVSDQRINFYVNGQRVVNAYDGSLDSGNLALTLLSGTNKDFGTRCRMSNIDLFILE
jgi:hypothetical protein